MTLCVWKYFQALTSDCKENHKSPNTFKPNIWVAQRQSGKRSIHESHWQTNSCMFSHLRRFENNMFCFVAIWPQVLQFSGASSTDLCIMLEFCSYNCGPKNLQLCSPSSWHAFLILESLSFPLRKTSSRIVGIGIFLKIRNELYNTRKSEVWNMNLYFEVEE